MSQETNARELLEGDVFPQNQTYWVVGPHAYNAKPEGTIELACYELADPDSDERADKLTIIEISEALPVYVMRNLGAVEVESKAGPMDVPENNLN